MDVVLCSQMPCFNLSFTWCFSRYLAVVVKAWAERPESSSEEEDEEPERNRKNPKKPTRARSLWKRVNTTKHIDRKTPHPPVQKALSSPVPSRLDTAAKLGVEELTKARRHSGDVYLHHKKATLIDTETTDDEGKPIKREPESTEVSEDEKTEKDHPNEEKPKRSRREVMNMVLRGAARAVGKMRRNAKKPRFNFEKYISYLQNVLSTIGFDIMGIIVTWNMVSTIIFLEVSVLSLFVQESIFGNSNATVSL